MTNVLLQPTQGDLLRAHFFFLWHLFCEMAHKQEANYRTRYFCIVLMHVNNPFSIKHFNVHFEK